jgi:hypothetical protein
MKTTRYAAVLLASVIALAANDLRKVGEKDPIPEFGFADAAALQKWSSTSSFGGGWSEKLNLPDQEIYWSYRQVTSGVATTELVFWMKKKDRLLPCLIMPLRRAEYRVALEAEEIVVKCWSHEAKGFEEVMRLKASFFVAPL